MHIVLTYGINIFRAIQTHIQKDKTNNQKNRDSNTRVIQIKVIILLHVFKPQAVFLVCA